MKYIVLLLIVLLVYSLPAEVLEVSESKTFLYTSSTTPKLHSTIKNRTDKKQTFTIRRKDLQLPEGWDSYFCFNSCFPPFMTEATVSLEAGESELLQVDYTIDKDKNSSGTAIVQYEIQLESDPNEVHIRTYGIHYSPESSKSSFKFHLKKAAVVTPLDKGGDHAFTIENTSDDEKDVTVSWDWIEDMEEWELSVCLDVCFPPMVKSTDLTINAKEKKELQIHVTPSDSGVGIVRYNIGPKGEDPTATLLFAYPTVGSESILVAGRQAPKELFVHRVNNIFTLALPMYEQSYILLYTSSGRQVASLYKGVTRSEQTTVAIPSLASGVYLLKVVSGTQSYAIPVTL